MKRVTQPSDVPQGPHFAVLIYQSHTYKTPGDERSRLHPGHGYPESENTVDSTEHWVTADKEELAKFVYDKKQKGEKLVFFAVEKPLTLDVKVDVNVK